MTVAGCIPLLIEEWQIGAAEAGSIVSGFYFAYASAEISFMSSKDQKELYSKSIKQVKGGQMDLNLAGMKSLDNLLKKLKNELPIMVANF